MELVTVVSEAVYLLLRRLLKAGGALGRQLRRPAEMYTASRRVWLRYEIVIIIVPPLASEVKSRLGAVRLGHLHVDFRLAVGV